MIDIVPQRIVEQDRRGTTEVNVYVSQPAVGFWPAANLTEMGNSKWSPLR